MTDTHDRPRPTWLLLAAGASACAGLVHAAAAGTHSGDPTLALIFALTAAVQLGWAALVLARPDTTVAAAGVAVGALAFGAWVSSRTTGVPLVGPLSQVEPVGLQDAVAALLGALAALLAIAHLVGARHPRPAWRAPTIAVTSFAMLALAVPAVAAGHSHGPSHEHAHGSGAEHAHAEEEHPGGDHAAGDPEHAHGDRWHPHVGDGGDGGTHAGHHDDPVVSLTDPRVTDEQREAAQTLIDDTVRGMARFTDVASVEAAGFISIGDGVTGWEHFVHYGNIVDGVELDPDRIESVVFKVYPDGTRQLASAMYILSAGTTMDDVPDIAGELTTWHDHQDLCWAGTQVVGVLDANGNCPRGTFRPTPPMLHVWLIPHPCGPFAGIEGSHGDGCVHDHGGDEAAPATRGGNDDEVAGGT